MKMLIAVLLACVSVALTAQPSSRIVGDFSSGRLQGWESEEFEGKTLYRLVEEGGRSVLRARSEDSASGLVRKQRIDLWMHPYLNWSWKIEERLPPRRESTKAGDDYPARVYLVVSGGLRFWKTQAVNYVWARNMEPGATWDNAFAGDNVTMVALRSQRDATGEWFEEKRNVLQDLQRFVDPDIRYIDAIAIMTDTDNTASSATSYYGDIYFSSH